MKKTTSGFTIVELLVVIVVIGVLAAIVIVAYNGIQQRAENSKNIAGVNQIINLMKLYKATNGTYPSAGTGITYNCLGVGYPSNICDKAADGSTQASNSSTFDTALTATGTIPQLSTKALHLSDGETSMGAYYEQAAAVIRYYLDGASQTCSAGGTGYNYGSVTECRLTLD
jgi:prepilin-type N-terminal cleavage/methylation domain-containing protein